MFITTLCLKVNYNTCRHYTQCEYTVLRLFKSQNRTTISQGRIYGEGVERASPPHPSKISGTLKKISIPILLYTYLY